MNQNLKILCEGQSMPNLTVYFDKS